MLNIKKKTIKKWHKNKNKKYTIIAEKASQLNLMLGRASVLVSARAWEMVL